MPSSRALLAILTSAAVGCLPVASRYHYETVPSTNAQAAPRPSSCAFDLLQLRPSRPFDELAIIENDMHYADNAELFKTLVADQVCQAGGDAIVAEPNSAGYYPGGVIIRYRPE